MSVCKARCGAECASEGARLLTFLCWLGWRHFRDLRIFGPAADGDGSEAARPASLRSPVGSADDQLRILHHLQSGEMLPQYLQRSISKHEKLQARLCLSFVHRKIVWVAWSPVSELKRCCPRAGAENRLRDVDESMLPVPLSCSSSPSPMPRWCPSRNHPRRTLPDPSWQRYYTCHFSSQNARTWLILWLHCCPHLTISCGSALGNSINILIQEDCNCLARKQCCNA